jgi:hypothetical protein
MRVLSQIAFVAPEVIRVTKRRARPGEVHRTMKYIV